MGRAVIPILVGVVIVVVVVVVLVVAMTISASPCDSTVEDGSVVAMNHDITTPVV